MGAFVMGSGYAFEFYRGFAGLEALQDRWVLLCKELGDHVRFYHHPHWFASAMQMQRAPDRDYWFVAAQHGERLVGVFPLQERRLRPYGAEIRLLSNFHDNQLQLADFTFSPESDGTTLVSALVRWLRSQKVPRWDAVNIQRIVADSALYRSLQVKSPSFTQRLTYNRSARFDVSQGYEHAVATMSPRSRRNLRRVQRRAAEKAPVRLEAVRAPALLPAALQRFCEIEASGWKGYAGTRSAILCSPTLVYFYQSLAKRFGPSGQFVIHLLWHGDAVVAAFLSLQSGKTFSTLKMCCQENAQAYKPGIMLLDLLIRELCADPDVGLLDMVNYPGVVRDFKPNSLPICSFVIPNYTVRGLASVIALKLLRQIARRSTRPLLPMDAQIGDGGEPETEETAD